MTFLFASLSILLIISTIIGLIKPSWIFPWGESTRQKIALIFVPITLVTVLLTSILTANNVANEMDMKISELQSVSLKEVEVALENLDANFTYYEETSSLLNSQFHWLSKTFLPYYETVEDIIDITEYTKHLNKVQWLESLHSVSQFSSITNFTSTIGISSRIISATLGELAIHMKNLETFEELDKGIINSINKLKQLNQEYEQTKELDLLIQMDKELKTTYLPLINELEYFIQESIHTFDTMATFFYQQENIKTLASGALDSLMFWREEEEELDSKQTLTELEENLDLIKNAPDELKTRIQSDTESILSFHSSLAVLQVLKELQN